MRKLRQRRVTFTCPKAHTQQTHGRIWLRSQLSESGCITCDTACRWSPRPSLPGPWMPLPPNQPATLPHCQMSLAALQTQDDNEVGLKKKKKQRERREQRVGENCSHHKFLSGPLPRFEDSGTAGKIGSRRGESAGWQQGG